MKKLLSSRNETIIVHGGAGKHRDIKKAEEGVQKACSKGFEVLISGGSALDAVCEAVSEMEENSYFNAGYGASLNIEGECELDACLMRGNDLKAGAVASLKNFKHPILIARRILEKLDHILLTGEGARRFALVEGFRMENLVTTERREFYKNTIKTKKLREIRRDFSHTFKWLEEHPHIILGTVGACALDRNGVIVSGTSTGGVFFKLKGRIGDTPCIGAGTYANGKSAISATGLGEGIMRICLSKKVSDLISSGYSPAQACKLGIEILEKKTQTKAGVIALGINGEIGFFYNTPMMPGAFQKKGLRKPELFGIEKSV